MYRSLHDAMRTRTIRPPTPTFVVIAYDNNHLELYRSKPYMTDRVGLQYAKIASMTPGCDYTRVDFA